MAIEAVQQAPEDSASAESDTSSAPSKGRAVVLMALAGVLAGGATGAFGAGPLIAKRKAAAGQTSVAERPTDPKAPVVVHPVENLVLNPAGTNGTRFLIVSATFQLKDGAADQLMKDHEAEVRDRVLDFLGKMTVEQLTDMGQRERIKKQVLASVSGLFPPGTIKRVFFPQFVIQ